MWSNLRNVLSGNSRRARARKPQSHRPLRHSITLEPLESRHLMTVLFAGTETRATASGVGDQFTFPESPTPVAMASTGKAVMVFSEQPAGFTDSDVILQVITTSGTLDPNGRIVVNTTLLGNQTFGNVAMNPTGSGNYVVVWSGSGTQVNNVDGDGVFMQRFNASNAKVGGEVLVNTTTAGVQSRPTVAMDENGNYVVSWIDVRTVNGVSRQNVMVRHFDAAGNPIRNDLEDNRVERIVSSTDQLQTQTSVAIGDEGNYLVLWSQNVGGRFRAMGRYFTPTNITQPFFLSDNSVAGNELFPTASIDDTGDFVVTWTLLPQDVSIDNLANDTTDIFVRRFFAPVFGSVPLPKTNPTGGTAPIIVPNSNFAGGTQRFSRVAVDRVTGDYTIVWDGVGPQTIRRTTTSTDTTVVDADTAATGGGVFGERFRADGRTIGETVANPTGGIFRANTTTLGPQRMSGVAIRAEAPSGATSANIIVAWSGAGIGDNQGAFFQRFQNDTGNLTVALGAPNPVQFATRTLTPIFLAPNATFSDVNALEYNGLQLEIVLSTEGLGLDALGAPGVEFLNVFTQGTLAGQISVAGNVISFGGVPIATFQFAALPTDPTKRLFTVTFDQAIMNTAGFRSAAVQAVMRNIQYQYTAPPLNRDVTDRQTNWTFVLVDNRTSATLNKTIDIVPECTGPDCTPTNVPIFRNRGFCTDCGVPSDQYATSLYQVLLERDGSPAEVNALAVALKNGYSPANAVMGFVSSVEYRRWLIADPTNGFYPRYLGRQADAAGVQFWLNAMANGVSEQQVLAGIVGSQEYFETQGGGTNAEYVNSLYSELLRRTNAPTSAELNYYVAQLNAGQSRAHVAYGFIYSREFNTQLVTEWWDHYLDSSKNLLTTPILNVALSKFGLRNQWRDVQAYILTTPQAIPVPLTVV